ncbi:dixin-like [Babylonia areolata]|uniref:dixin-like n=1 Tax=Babylonia areolata TaxID=304850 RepID=UPI003FD55672
MESEGTRTVWIEPQQQLGAYVAWVNSQLKKKPGVHLIEDLRNDMRDGVVFADIIEIVAKEPVSGIYEVPATYKEMQHNVEQVLKFMTIHHIKMHRIRAADIVEGNLKAVMRLILALAAHYKPMSVRHSTHSSSSRSVTRRQSVIDIAQGASAALTEARRNAKKAGKRSSRYVPDGKYQESSSEPYSDTDGASRRASQGLSLQAPEPRELDGCSAENSPVSSPRSSFCLPDGRASFHGQEGDGMSEDSGVPPAWGDTQLDTIRTMKKQLLQLQHLMLEQSVDSGVEGEDGEGDAPSTEDWVLVKSRLQQATLLNQDLREELSLLRNDCLQLQGTKAGLQQRLGEQDAMLSQLKSDKLHLEIEMQTVAMENASLRKQLKSQVGRVQGDIAHDPEPRDQTISYLRGELARKERVIRRLHQEITPPHDTQPHSVQLRHSHPPLLSELGKQNNITEEIAFPAQRPVSMQAGRNLGPAMEGEGGDGPKTSVIYFMDFSEHPRTCVIPGRLGEIRLRDLKRLFAGCERYRYYFKALDPEYGTVKEELTKEDAVVPGWEDKIVAWVETESGTPC